MRAEPQPYGCKLDEMSSAASLLWRVTARPALTAAAFARAAHPPTSTCQTGARGDRMGVPLANSDGVLRPDSSVGFTGSSPGRCVSDAIETRAASTRRPNQPAVARNRAFADLPHRLSGAKSQRCATVRLLLSLCR